MDGRAQNVLIITKIGLGELCLWTSHETEDRMSKSVAKRLTVQLPPGSEKAIKMGCTCAVMDNRHGKGAFDGPDGTYWISANCPLHGEGACGKSSTL